MGGRATPRPEKMMDDLTMRARALNLGTRVEVGGALCSWPITSAEAPHPSPHSPPTRRSSRHFPSKYFQGYRPKIMMEASSSHAPMLLETTFLQTVCFFVLCKHIVNRSYTLQWAGRPIRAYWNHSLGLRSKVVRGFPGVPLRRSKVHLNSGAGRGSFT